MGYYSSEVEQKLKTIKTDMNRLFWYDNVTYHIRLGMMSVSSYKKYTEYKIEGNMEMMQNIINTECVTICETGVQHNPAIQSLSIKSTAGRGSAFHQPETVNTDFEMVLEDCDGMSLMSKIHTVAFMLGYDKGILQMPYFLTIWFEGYNIYDEEGRRLTEPNWCIERRRYFYEVVVAQATSQVQPNKTTWNLKLTTNGLDIMGKNFSGLANLGAITIPKGEDYITTVAKSAASYINQRIKESYPASEYERIFGSAMNKNKDAFIFIVYDEFGSVIVNTSPVSMEKASAFASKVNSTGEQKAVCTFQNPQGISGYKYAIAGDAAKHVLAAQETIFRPEKNTTIGNLFTKLINEHLSATNYNGLTANVVMERIFAGSYRGRTQYITIANVYLEPMPGLQREENSSNPYEQFTDVVEKQKSYIDFCKKKNLILRSYNWQQDAQAGGVLSFDTKLDELWYANSGLSALRMAANTVVNSFGSRDTSWTDKLKAFNDAYEKRYETTVEKISNLVVSEGKRKNAELYSLDDFYKYARKNDLLPGQILAPIAVFDDTNTAEQPSSTSNTVTEALERAKAIVGYNNLIDSGQCNEINMKIVGDPVWLEIGAITPTNDHTNFYNAHIKFELNAQYNVNDANEYEDDDINHLVMLYAVTEVFSEFRDGKFTQSLKGYVPLPFLWSDAQLAETNTSSSTTKAHTKNNATKTASNGPTSNLLAAKLDSAAFDVFGKPGKL